MFQFVLKESGGLDGHILKNTTTFVRKMCKGMNLNKDIYEALSAFNRGPGL